MQIFIFFISVSAVCVGYAGYIRARPVVASIVSFRVNIVGANNFLGHRFSLIDISSRRIYNPRHLPIRNAVLFCG